MPRTKKLLPKPFIKAKKVINRCIVDEQIKEIAKRKKVKEMPKHVILLENPYYITCNSVTFILKAVNEGLTPTGNKKKDDCILYSPWLDHMLKVAANHMIKVNGDVQALSNKVDELYDMIMTRTPHVRPKDLFTDFETEEEIAEALKNGKN